MISCIHTLTCKKRDNPERGRKRFPVWIPSIGFFRKKRDNPERGRKLATNTNTSYIFHVKKEITPRGDGNGSTTSDKYLNSVKKEITPRGDGNRIGIVKSFNVSFATYDRKYEGRKPDRNC